MRIVRASQTSALQGQAAVEMGNGVVTMGIAAVRPDQPEPKLPSPWNTSTGLAPPLPWDSSKDMQSFSATSWPLGRAQAPEQGIHLGE